MLMSELWPRWLRTKALMLSPTTLSLYEEHVRFHLNPAFGARDLAGITEDDILGFIETKRRTLARNTVSTQVNLLRQVFAYAVARGFVPASPLQAIRFAAKAKSSGKALNEQQAGAFLDAAKRSRYYPLYLLALSSGLRRGELMGLRWQDIDWGTATLHIRETCTYLCSSSKWITKEPKSKAGLRPVQIPATVLAALRDMYDRRNPLDGRVFAGRNYKPWSIQHIVARDLPRVCASAGVPKLRLHDLRHTHATLLLQMKFSPRAVQERLGHSNVAFTLSIYGHVLPGAGAEMAMALQSKWFDTALGEENRT